MDTLIVERLGHRGDGIAQGPVYVPGALPGEEVTGDIVNGVMVAPKIVTPSENRVKPPCSHARSCGGCQLQHARDDFVADWKSEVVRIALAAQGISAEFLPIQVSAEKSRRRASFSARRTKKGALAGFHQKASDVVIEVPNCTLVLPQIADALPLVRKLATVGASRKGELAVTVTDSLGGLDIAVQGGREVDAEFRMELAELARAFGLARLTWGDESLTRLPPEQAFGAAKVIPPPGAFLQATKDGEAALLSGVQTALKGCKSVVDLFAGCGTFALPLAQDARVHAVEGEKDMVRALDHGWRNAQGLKRVTHEAKDLFRNPLLPDELSQFDGVVIDPPRAGAEAQVAQIAIAKPSKIAFVSCNPVTFARDASTLIAAGYRLNWVQVVDQFRWSTHVELVAEFELGD